MRGPAHRHPGGGYHIPMADEVRLSVALVTRNRPASLERTLASLRAQDVQPHEVVLSDDSADHFAGQIERIADRFGCRYLRGPRRGLYANRNHAALACTGTHIRSMDDDHEFPPGHLAACMAAIHRDRASVWIIGEYGPGQEKPGVPPPCPGQLTPRGYSSPPPDSQRCWALADGASIYPRAIFDRGLRFAEDFKFGALYLEFGSRLYWLGYRIRFLPITYVVHHFDSGARSFNDPENDFAAQFFAALCHSFIYQPGTKNRLLCIGEMAKLSVRHGAPAVRAAWRARGAHRAHYRSLQRQGQSPLVDTGKRLTGDVD